ncbi:cysteine protease XCP2-like [Phragmites australis]|uniref:cysteine protease XCP2-like n=1 Tax=Phragmites australis TaxID=29695 RepID=UPI002D776920|nr:cysteine protease XCP2-like [Phragmites australis]
MASSAHVMSKLSLAVVLLMCAGACLVEALPHRDFSIVGYSPDDLASHDRLIKLFEEWVAKYRKAYASFEEKLRRFEVFEDNLKHIDEINKKVSSYWLGLNEFADLTHDEFKATYLGLRPSSSSRDVDGEAEGSFRYEGVRADKVPKAVDWRKKGAVTEVKNQGQCGSCWAFSTVAAVEGINQIVTGNLTSLSEQELIDCSTDGNNGCNGGIMDYAFSYIAGSGGLHTEEAYPYLMEEGDCGQKAGSGQVVTISGYEDVPANDEQGLIKALAHQPVSVAIEASGRHFQFYSGGVFDGPCGAELDHGVAAVGYGTSKGQDYIIVKNSWGSHWGEKGYIRMKRGTGKPEGLCGINKMASYPTKDPNKTFKLSL